MLTFVGFLLYIKKALKKETVCYWQQKSLIQYCSQTVLPDRSIIIGQKWAENVKIEKRK